MPENARRRRAPARQYGQEPARRGQEGRYGQDARRGSDAPHRGAAPARRNGPGRRPRTTRPVRPAQPEPYSELDQALSDAAAQPEPQIDNFAQLGLPERLIRALAAHDIEAPFAIQRRALPDALAGKDVLGRAQTGSGKTLAFGLPLLARLAADVEPRRRGKAPRGLVLVPTRELAQQVADVLGPLGRAIGVTTMTVYGGVPYSRQITRLRDGVDLVVATPGRLIDLMDQHACNLGEIEITVLDEADHMADLGFLPAVTRILDATPAGGQRMLFSATLDRRVGLLVTNYLNDPALHAVAQQEDSAVLAEHRVLVTPDNAEKLTVATAAGEPPGADPVLRPHQARGGPAGPAADPGRGGGGSHSRQPHPEAAPARARCVRAGSPAGAGGHRRGRPRHPRGRRGAGRALRPAQRPQGLPAPLRPDGARRGFGPGRDAGRREPGP